MVIPLDRVARKLPFSFYNRFHLDALFVFWALERDGGPGLARLSPSRLLQGLGARAATISNMGWLVAALVSIDAVILGIGGYMYLDSGRESTRWWFDERGVIPSVNVAQLLIAAAAGIATYNLFWKTRLTADRAQAFGIFLWGIGGCGLMVFALEDFFSVHEVLGKRFAEVMPGISNSPDDIFMLVYAAISLAILYVFHTELVAVRGSSALLLGAALAAIVMVITDAFAHAPGLKAIELPAQSVADSMLLAAFVARYREVKSSVNLGACRQPVAARI
jgi:hypothetical protein